jgi:RNA polymerase sigma-70 factor, ECF subfamily
VIGQGSILPFTAEREVVDRDLNRRIANHEDGALGELYDRYGLLLYGFVVRLLRSAADAEQLIHDHFLNFWNSSQRYPENRGTLYSQLVFSLRTQVVGRMTGRGLRRAPHGPDSAIPLLVPDRTGVLRALSAIDEDTVNSMVTAVWALPSDQQRVLALGWFDGFRTSEIAERLSLPHDRVIAALNDALSVITALFIDVPHDGGNSHPARYDALSTVFALDLLDGNPRRDLEAHLRSGCVRCSESIAITREIGAIMPVVLAQVRPSPELREKILFSARLAQVAKAHLESDGKAKAIFNAPGPEVVTAASVQEASTRFYKTAALITAGVVILAMAFYINTLHSVINEKEEYERTLEQKVFLSPPASSAAVADTDVISAPHLSTTNFYGLGSRIMESGRILWSRDVSSAIVSCQKLPPLAEGQSYRLWFVRDHELHPGPVLSLAADKATGTFKSYQRVGLTDPPDSISGIAVTRETEGDTSGRLFLFGRLQQ